MFSARLAHAVLQLVDRIPFKPDPNRPAHLRTGKRGEEDAYFYLRQKGYVIVARNYRTSRHRGEIDLIGWDKDVLCFIEVKTRTTRDVKPAEAAVDRKKRHDLRTVIRDYLRTLPRRQFPEPPPWRFDVITVYYENKTPRKPTSGLSAPPSEPFPRSIKENSSPNTATAKPNKWHALHPTFELFQNVALSS